MDTKSILAMSFLSGKTSDIYQTVIQTMMLSSMAHIEKLIGQVIDFFNKKLTKKIENIVEKTTSDSDNKDVEYELTYSHGKYYVNITYVRPEKNDISNNLDLKYLNAILHRITKINNIPSLSVCKDVITPTNVGESFEIKDGIYCKIKEYKINLENNLEKFKAEIYSSVCNSSQIISYIKALVVEQENDKTNDIMSELYVFTVEESNEMRYNPDINNMYRSAIRDEPVSINIDDELSKIKAKIASAPPNLEFKTNIFVSNRRQENVKGEVASSIFTKLNFFTSNKKWYSEKGIPYHFTCMLSGLPGMGKTSTVKAVANITKRHLFIVNCGEIKTSKQFNNLFTKEDVKIKTESGVIVVKIPIEKRIYVLEELDILGEMLWDRSVSKYKHIEGGLSLDDFLNVFDGNIESPGRIIFLTSNYPEKLDRALTRGGRVDIIAKFKPLGSLDIIEYIKFFHSTVPSDEIVKSINEQNIKWNITYADLCQVLFSNPGDLTKSLLDKNDEKQEYFLKTKNNSSETLVNEERGPVCIQEYKVLNISDKNMDPLKQSLKFIDNGDLYKIPAKPNKVSWQPDSS